MNISETYEFMQKLTRLRKAGEIGQDDSWYNKLRRKHPEHLSPECIEELVEYAEAIGEERGKKIGEEKAREIRRRERRRKTKKN